MTTKRLSAGLMMYRRCAERLEVLLVHPGGPFWVNKDDGAWTIPKGEPLPDEALLDVACREFREETSLVPVGPFVPLSPVRLKSGKWVHAWAFAGDCDPTTLRSNTFEVEWPPRSGRLATFPEVDRAGFFAVAEARRKLHPGQLPLLEELISKLAPGG